MSNKRITIQQIWSDKKVEVEKTKADMPLSKLKDEIARAPQEYEPRDFKGAVSAGPISIIAEIKRFSPSHGDLYMDLNVTDVARTYDASCHVSCISVLTDEKYFGCTKDDMLTARAATGKPVLRKDFVLDEYQVYEARRYGADAVLLIATLLDEDEVSRFSALTFELGMEPFVECHELEDIPKIPASVNVVGINTRNLSAKNLKNTHDPDLSIVARMLPEIPDGKIVIAESGVKTPDDIVMLQNLDEGKISAVLTGATIVGSGEIDKIVETIEGLMSGVNSGDGALSDAPRSQSKRTGRVSGMLHRAAMV